VRISLRRSLTPRAVRWLARLVFLAFLSIPFALVADLQVFDDLFTNPRYGGLESKLSRDEA